MFPAYVGSLSKYMESRSSKYNRLSDSGLCLQACLDSVREDGWNFGVERALEMV